MSPDQWVCCLMGARMHYAVPRILYQNRLLANFYADICASHGWPRVLEHVPKSLLPAGLRRLAARQPKGIPRHLITSFTNFGLQYQRRRSRARSISEMTATHLWAGSTFCRLILNSNPPEYASLYVFNSAGLELLQAWKKRGRLTVLEQTIAPREIEDRMLQSEEQSFQGWQEPLPKDDNVKAFIDREAAEWSEAAVILCGSEFVREGIRECGGPVERCKVVPYGIDLRNFPAGEKPSLRHRRLRVLIVGEIGLRKGSHYVLQAALRMKGSAEFRMAGPMGFVRSRAAELQRDIEWVGVVSRESIANHYAWADVLLLPSLCEGSATTTYEALSAGLPLIVTPNVGSIVEDGVSGWLVPVGDVEAIVHRLEGFIQEPARLMEMSRAAQDRSKMGTLEAYRDRLLSAVGAAPNRS